MADTYMGIEIDLSRDELFDEIGLQRLRDSYMMEGETSPQHRYAYVSKTFGSNPEHSQRLYDYASKHWLGYSTPVLSYGRNSAGMPISCFLVNVHDSKEGLVEALSETNWLSMLGGGVGVYFGIRGTDEKSVGVIPHMSVYDRSSLAYKQGTTRRGSYAMYLDISHPDVLEFLDMRKETGDQNRRCLNLHHGINIPDKFMQIIERCMYDKNADDSWELRDPATGKLHDTVSAKALWAALLELRAGQGRGEPYILFTDNVNNAVLPILRERGYKVVQSNLCSEITLHTDKDTTAVCCLSSINLEHWDEYKDNYQFFLDVAEMLDNVLQKFIDTAPQTIKRAIKSAVEERSIGVGVMGFHSYLQKNNIAFSSAVAKSANIRIFNHFKANLDRANRDLGALRGSPKWMEGTGLRFAHVSAIAPTASNALICGNVSPSIELWRANAFRQDTLSGTFIQKNKHLDALLLKLAAEGKVNYDEAWLHIVQHEGSVQELDGLDEHTKAVYETAVENDQMWAVEHTADRQPFIDQGQSFNVFIRPDISIARLHTIHYTAWKKGVKAMYYTRSEKLANTDTVGKRVARVRIEEEIEQLRSVAEDSACLACEG